jgi:hypothetical protein
MRSALFWDITQRTAVILPTFWDKLSVPFSRVKEFLDFFTLEDGTGRLSRNVGIELPLYAA